MPTITVSPASENDDNTLKEFSQEQRNFYKRLNNIRWENFENRDKIFEKTLQDVPDSKLPQSTKQILLKSNAQDWGKHTLQAVKTGHLSRMKSSDIISNDNIWFDKTELAKPIGRFPTLCLTARDIEHTEKKIRISGENDAVIFDILNGEEHIQDLCETPLYIYKNNDNYIIEPYDINTSPEYYLSPEEKSKQEDFQAVLKTLSVAASVTAVSQIEVKEENQAFPSLFTELSLYWEKVDITSEFDVYLIGTQKRGKERINKFLSTDETDRTVEDYCKLLGIPTSVAEYYCNNNWTDKNYDRYSAEEFAIYAWLDGEIKQQEMKLLLYTPYRPPPEEKEIKYAIQLAKQFQEGLKILYNEAPSEEDYNQLMNYYEQHNTHQSLIRDKPIIEVYNWLVNCEHKQKTQTTD